MLLLKCDVNYILQFKNSLMISHKVLICADYLRVPHKHKLFAVMPKIFTAINSDTRLTSHFRPSNMSGHQFTSITIKFLSSNLTSNYLTKMVSVHNLLYGLMGGGRVLLRPLCYHIYAAFQL